LTQLEAPPTEDDRRHPDGRELHQRKQVGAATPARQMDFACEMSGVGRGAMRADERSTPALAAGV
jgi:hypothetical protein